MSEISRDGRETALNKAFVNNSRNKYVTGNIYLIETTAMKFIFQYLVYVFYLTEKSP